MEVIGHQNICEQGEPIPFSVSLQEFEVRAVIRGISEDHLALVAPSDHMVQRARDLGADWTGHAGFVAAPGVRVNKQISKA
jgi:hypothetical protein